MRKCLPVPALLLLVSLLMGCDPLAPYDPTPVAIVITSPPTATVPPTATPTPTLTPTLPPTATPELLPTPTLFPCDEQTGQVIEFDDNLSAIADENLRFRVYVPPCYFSTQRRFPLVILLHGLSYREEQWEDLGMLDALDAGILAGELPPMLLVMPYLGSMGQFNQFPPDPSYERVILEELLPQVERNFCVWSRPAYRAIAGISRGGFWAYSIALRHPDIFGVAAAHSGYFPNDTGEIPPPFNPLELALNSPALQEAGLRLYLDNGAGDSAGPSVQLLSSRLTQRSIQHTYVVNPTGEHDNTYWGSQVREYLAFYGRTWSRDYNALPSCAEPA